MLAGIAFQLAVMIVFVLVGVDFCVRAALDKEYRWKARRAAGASGDAYSTMEMMSVENGGGGSGTGSGSSSRHKGIGGGGGEGFTVNGTGMNMGWWLLMFGMLISSLAIIVRGEFYVHPLLHAVCHLLGLGSYALLFYPAGGKGQTPKVIGADDIQAATGQQNCLKDGTGNSSKSVSTAVSPTSADFHTATCHWPSTVALLHWRYQAFRIADASETLQNVLDGIMMVIAVLIFVPLNPGWLLPERTTWRGVLQVGQ